MHWRSFGGFRAGLDFRPVRSGLECGAIYPLAQAAAVPATKQPGCSLVSITPAAAYVGALQGRLAALTPNVIAKGAYVVALIPPGAPT